MAVATAETLSPAALAAEIKRRARAEGFDLVGITSAEPSRFRDYWREWLNTGKHGVMAYLADRVDLRLDPSLYLDGARSVICVAMNYHTPLSPADESMAAAGGAGRIARYALGKDYHEVIKPRLWAIADWIRAAVPGAATKCGVDTAPVSEKELAARAGIGWVGKNTCVIHANAGSWLFLGSILTTLDLPPDLPGVDRCGSCRRCIDACPTAAITAPYQLNATRCISYLTIETVAEPPAELRGKIGDWLYGCDICQEVCPFNREALSEVVPALVPRFSSGRLDARAIIEGDDETCRAVVRGSAMKRIKLPVLRRNASVVIENAGFAS